MSIIRSVQTLFVADDVGGLLFSEEELQGFY